MLWRTAFLEEEIAIKPSLSTHEYNATVTATAPDGTSKTKNVLIPNMFPMTAKGQLTVEAVDLVKQTDGTATFSITVRNTGEKPIASCNVTVYGDSGTATLSLGAIEVGQTRSLSAANPSDFSVTVGDNYIVIITAEFSDGSTFTHTTSVQCRYG